MNQEIREKMAEIIWDSHEMGLATDEVADQIDVLYQPLLDQAKEEGRQEGKQMVYDAYSCIPEGYRTEKEK